MVSVEGEYTCCWEWILRPRKRRAHGNLKMEQEDENISLLLNMGFPDVRAIKRALKLSNGDVNEAVTFLTEQPLTSYSTVDDLRDVEMADPALRPPSYDEVGLFTFSTRVFFFNLMSWTLGLAYYCVHLLP